MTALSRLLSLEQVTAIAHRGGSRLRPENTLIAFEHAATLGVDAIECDVHLSKDGDVVIVHDATLDRTTDAQGPVAAHTADELARADAGFGFAAGDGFPYRGRGAGVPRLSHALRRLPAMPFVIEIKGAARGTAARVLECVRDEGALDRVVIGGFDRGVLDEVRRLAPVVPTSASSPEVQSAMRRAIFRLRPRSTGYRLFQVPVRLRGRTVLTRPLVRLARRAGLPVQVWVVDDPGEMRQLIAMGVTGLISDRPDLAVAAALESRPF
jgi:glycerophosphoryl diester phosphodiesterase